MIAGAGEDAAAWLPVATLRPIAVRCSDMVSAFAAGQACCDAKLRSGRAEQVGPVVASVAWRAGPGSTLGPDAGQFALLAEPSTGLWRSLLRS